MLAPGQTFTARYTVIKLLGAGGMGEVYQAWDESLGVAVALKLIRSESTTSPDDRWMLEERFKRELRLGRQVTHPNVVRIHDLGDVNGTKYLTMEYLPGRDLSSLVQAGRLPLARALPLARQIVAGLAAVHQAGIIHRDLKPANVLVAEGDRAVLTDFGIARPVDSATFFTAPGAVVGTLDYLAPEQARGEAADRRSDIYAFGLVLYELLVGRRPRFSRDGGVADVIARIDHGPPPPRTIDPSIPVALERIVQKCLDRSASNRYQDAGELQRDLERLDAEGHLLFEGRRFPRTRLFAAAAALLAVVAAGYVGVERRVPAAPPQPHESVSILVADFENRVNDPVFSGSIEQALGIAMEGAPFVTAFPREDASRLVHQLRPGATLDEAGARLVAYQQGIRVVLSGDVERQGASYRIVVRGLYPDRDTPFATAQADAASKVEVLQAVGRVAESMRRALGDTAPGGQLGAETFSAGSLEAVRRYTIAQQLSANRRNEEAIQQYKAAVASDPNFGRAYAGLAAAEFDLGRREQAGADWNKALSLMDRMTDREKYRTLGSYYIGVAHNYDLAIENLTRLVQQYPADLSGHNNLAIAYFDTLRFPEALAEGRRAIQLYPKRLKFRGNYALFAMYAGDYASAASTARQVLTESAAYVPAYLPLAMQALHAGDVPAAEGIYRRAAAQGDEGATLAGIGLADVLLYEGRLSEAETVLVPAIERDRRQQNTIGASAKLIALAELEVDGGRSAAAARTLDDAVGLLHDDAALVPAARLLLQAGNEAAAGRIAEDLARQVPAQSRAYARLIQAERQLARGDAPGAIQTLKQAERIADLWLVRYDLGRAYFAAGQAHYAEALGEFQVCLKRSGEATAVFLDDQPTYRYMAPVIYGQARVEEAFGMKGAAADYAVYASLRSGAEHDPLVEHARRRAAALK